MTKVWMEDEITTRCGGISLPRNENRCAGWSLLNSHNPFQDADYGASWNDKTPIFDFQNVLLRRIRKMSSYV